MEGKGRIGQTEGRPWEGEQKPRERVTAGEEAGGSTWGEHGLSSVDRVQEPNCP